MTLTAVSDETGREPFQSPQHIIEGIILRRLHDKRIEGYTLEMSKEIEAALSASPVAQEPVAWVEFTEAGLIRFWTSDAARAEIERTKRSLTKFSLSELIALVGRPRIPPATPAGLGVPTKRPSAFRVPRAVNDGEELSPEAYRLFNDEAEARSAAEALGVDYEGLYLAKDRPSAGVGADEIAHKVLDEVVCLADAVYADTRNDIQDRRAIRTFIERYRKDEWGRRAILALLSRAGDQK